jgi:hypothetical protein
LITKGEWEKHYSELLTENRLEYKVMTTHPPCEDRKLIITKEEVRVAVSNLKNNKAPGPGELPAELLKYRYGPEGVLEELTGLF